MSDSDSDSSQDSSSLSSLTPAELAANVVSKFQVKSTDMSEEMVEGFMGVLTDVLSHFEIDSRRDDFMNDFPESELAEALKKEMDKKYQPAWHCVVGGRFGTFVTHSKGNFIYIHHKGKGYSAKETNIVVFKT